VDAFCNLDRVYFSFFFSSRRRHTRFKCDWSSDVCSSDLRTCRENAPQERDNALPFLRNETDRGPQLLGRRLTFPLQSPPGAVKRSEERRVGKECRCGWVP